MIVPERRTIGQILQVSRIKQLGHIQAQFLTGFQEYIHIILGIQITDWHNCFCWLLKYFKMQPGSESHEYI